MEDRIQYLECVGCDRIAKVDDMGLCSECATKLDRDMLRSREWDRSWTGWHTPDDQRETLRWQIISEYGPDYELIAPSKDEKKATSPFLNLEHPDTPAPAGNYTEADVIEGLEAIFRETPIYMWCDLQDVSVHLRKRFEELNPKVFGYKSLRRLIQAHPKKFSTRWDKTRKKRHGRIYVRLARDHTQAKEGTMSKEENE